ncbi:T9SS type A sorting domain-containing protein [Gracilimonas mengyeensis]|uniref:Por secretion system C-terminal sorting domain-containing protein n=1 Tax=Gracilimonas mengyeensis TaxID=1302730 RepID=A0A521B6B9_9BACT|nr:T9SS type A sorting domain-containing protein [Gracilimonas mengyeensis]SMO42654.1 Por secretion system C-terminal sorting domain-containing protein [Gracilimonas mengyeensis]
MRKYILWSLFVLIPTLITAQNQSPQVHDSSLGLRAVAQTPSAPVKIAHNPTDGYLYVLTQSSGIHRVDVEANTITQVQTASELGIEDAQGLTISSDGTFYLVGNNPDTENATNIVYIKRGVIDGDAWTWSTVATTAPYPLSNTDFDHIMNEIKIGPNDEYLYINSGSRTDHGEEQAVWGEGYPDEGLYPGTREVPLTAKILKVPADSTDLFLENDLNYLNANGYIFAEGTRNSFGLAFDGEGRLFSADNAGERDDPGEFNWLQEGKHYGFPWRIGGNDTPMQFEGYNPEEDLLLSTDSRDAIFYNDPDYPAPPEDLEFTEPILNYGPDGVNYKDAETGEVLDASAQDTAIASFTGHRSSLGLVFDADSALSGNYTGDGFVLAFTGGNDPYFLLQHMNDPGEDLLHLELTPSGDTFTMNSTRIASGFLNPIDSEIVGDKIYVLEFKNSWLNGWSQTHIWEVDFSGMSTSINETSPTPPPAFALDQNYPNPFNPVTVITYKLPVKSEVTLEVFDIAGRKVTTLLDQPQFAGTHTVNFDAGHLSSGVYFYKLSVTGSQSFTKVRKMTLLK